MKFKTLIGICALLAFTAGVASAATVNMNMDSLEANGWNAVVKNNSSDPRANVQDKLNASGANAMSFSPGRSENSNWSWAGISTNAYAGRTISEITALNIRVYGNEGDGAEWQCPTFHFALSKAGVDRNNRFATWIPWADGTPRAPGQWNTYNALTDGYWVVSVIGRTYATFADLVAAYPNATFYGDSGDVNVRSVYPEHPSTQSFNVMSGTWINEEVKYFSSARGMVDWFEVGVNGDVTRYDLGEAAVPEPGSIVALATGFIGLVGLRRRMAK